MPRNAGTITAVAAVWLAAMTMAGAAQAAEPRISFELLLEDPYAREAADQWHGLITAMPRCSARVRGGRDGDETGIRESGEGNLKSFRVTGIITKANRLALPGGTFSLRDRDKIKVWIDRLRSGGEEGLRAPQLAFGLTPKQLTAIHDKLAHVVTIQTKGLTVADAARRIAADARIVLQSDPSARAGAAERVENELKGISAGSALSAALRPGGLVLVLEPQSGGDVALRIRTAAAAKEFWPVGWPLQQAPGKLAPEIFKELSVEITSFPLAEALDAVADRLPIPFVFDHNSLAREGIDPAVVRVSHPAGKSYYKRIVDRMLSQARLTGTWRQDEAGQVFYWITTLRQARPGN